MTISVVIPTYNEEKGIAKCIESILANTELPCEIIVADGMSCDRTKELAIATGATVYDNPNRTAASGRNVGIMHAKGDIIAFTDGDNYVHPEWIASIRAAFESDGNIDAIGGKVVGAPPETEVEKFWSELWLKNIMVFPDEEFYVKERNLRTSFITANCAYKKELLTKLSGFDEWFGNNAEDVDLMWRALDSGATLKYTPKPIVYAHSPTKRKQMLKKSYRDGVSSTKLQKRYGPKKGSFDGRLHKMFWKSIGPTLLFRKNAHLLTGELFYHIMGKWISSIKFGYRNL